MTAPQAIMDLVELFDHNVESYRSGKYNETQVRLQFINPFFKALGWDVDNEKGHAEAYKDVFHEDAVKVGGSTKAPDYSFRIGGTRKFFVEAKKPSVNLKDDITSAFQLRRYSWSAKLPLGILTDFDELAVYDGRIQPSKTDKASVARVKYFTYKEYVDKWDEIASIFSKEAILKGSFDKYAESTKGKRGTAGVDNAFLQEIEIWRDLLARNIALRNPDLTTRELNFSVQRTIDRIVFLRICEDRGIERYGRLQSLLEGARVYTGLCEFFRQADERYNAGLFHFGKDSDRLEPPDELTLRLEIDDKPLKEIIKSIYYPDSPYEFSVLPPEILGHVYEQFLGKVISVSPGRRVNVDYKPEVRKAGGVYYTPSYIVEYIVDNTVGKLLEGQTPSTAAELRVLDPACGSGSFLIGAYQKLLDWHRDWYVEKLVPLLEEGKTPASKEVLALLPAGYTAPNKKRGKKEANRDQSPEFPIFEAKGGEWKLTTRERRRILLNNIYGVDIDSQAVEVTKLSLHLKVLEGENEETLSKQLKLFQERALPYLGRNIKCGNSLIGPDFYDGQTSLFDEEEMYRVNAFDWEAEFPDVMERGGFDAVIGNPPYLRIQGLQQNYGNQIGYFINNYQSAVKRFDLYLAFTEKGFKLLSRNGLLAYICPHKFINSNFGSGLRKFLIENTALECFISFGSNLIFEQASTYTGILLCKNNKNNIFRYYEFQRLGSSELKTRLFSLEAKDFSLYNCEYLSDRPWIFVNKEIQSVLKKLYQQPAKLGDIFEEIVVGVQSGIDEIHLLRTSGSNLNNGIVKLYSERENADIIIEFDLVKPILKGEDVHRYDEPKHSHYIIYPYKLIDNQTKIIEEAELESMYPLGYSYLKKYKDELIDIRTRQKTNPKYWYSCHRSRSMALFESERIIAQEISLGCNMTLCKKGIYHNTTVYSLFPSSSSLEYKLYWLGILNSKIMWWFLTNTGNVLSGGYFRFKTEYLRPFPIRTIDFSDPADVARHDKMVSLVERMLDLHKRLTETKIAHEKTHLQRLIEATDDQIDRLVYELYGLTEEEIRIIEEAKA